jgi:hypothetical protein
MKIFAGKRFKHFAFAGAALTLCASFAYAQGSNYCNSYCDGAAKGAADNAAKSIMAQANYYCPTLPSQQQAACYSSYSANAQSQWTSTYNQAYGQCYFSCTRGVGS